MRILLGDGNDAGGEFDAAARVFGGAHQVVHRLEDLAAVGIPVDEQQLRPLDGQLIRRAGKIPVRRRLRHERVRGLLIGEECRIIPLN